MWYIGFDPGPLNSAVAILRPNKKLYSCVKLPPIIDISEDIDEYYRALICELIMIEKPAFVTMERFSSRGQASKIAEICNIQIGLLIGICKVKEFRYSLVLAQSWKRKNPPEYPAGCDHHLHDAKLLALNPL